MLMEEDGVTAAWDREVLTLFASLYTHLGPGNPELLGCRVWGVWITH